MMRTRAIFSVVLLGFGATACTQILGIDERTLRDDTKTTSNGSTTGNDDGGAPRTDSGTDAGESTSEAGFPFDAAEAPRAYVQSAPVDFGQVYCGAPAPADKSVHVANVGGDGDLDWEASLDQTSVFSIDGPPAGNLDAADSFVDVKIASAGAPAFATAGVVTATLTITIKQAGVLVSKTDIPVTQTAAGATLSLDPSSIAFGQVQTGSSATPIAVSLRNTGNMPISIGFGAASDPQFSLVNGNGTTLAPGQS
ncbi:MAG TPA: hypothetical protein VF407_22225, partial [Polyangiaceae bacterium]